MTRALARALAAGAARDRGSARRGRRTVTRRSGSTAASIPPIGDYVDELDRRRRSAEGAVALVIELDTPGGLVSIDQGHRHARS